MSIFDIFSSWKKVYSDLEKNHKEALLAFINNSYYIYNDMRQDHKTLFQEYRQLYQSEIKKIVSVNSIDMLTNDAKKYIVHNKEYILTLFNSYKKYSSKKERVRNLASRFAIGNIFSQTAKTIVGTDNIDLMTEDNLSDILLCYDMMVEQAHEILRKKNMRKIELKEKLSKKIKARRDKIREEKERRDKIRKAEEEKIEQACRMEEERLRIKAEKKKLEDERSKIEKEISQIKDKKKKRNKENAVDNEIESLFSIFTTKFPYDFGSLVTDSEKIDVRSLYMRYKHHGIFDRVIRSKIPSMFNSNLIFPSEVKQIKSLIKEFEKEVDFFNKVKAVPERRKKYKKLIKKKGISDMHEGIMYCLHNLRELDAIDEVPVPLQSSVILKRPSSQESNPIAEFDNWKKNQEKAIEILNTHIKLFPKVSLHLTKMYVDVNYNDEGKKKILTFPHVIFYEMGKTSQGNLNKKRDAYLGIVRSCKKFVPIVLPEYRMLVCSIAKDFKPKETLFVCETSGSQKSSELNSANFNDIFVNLKNNGYKNWGYLGNEGRIFKCVIVLEIGSESDQFRKSSKKISKKFPGAAIIYISVYGELTDIQIKNKFGKKQ